MPNMSYIRFENTYRDLLDCYYALQAQGANGLSDRELDYSKLMMIVCKNMTNFTDEINDELDYRRQEQDFDDSDSSMLYGTDNN